MAAVNKVRMQTSKDNNYYNSLVIVPNTAPQAFIYWGGSFHPKQSSSPPQIEDHNNII